MHLTACIVQSLGYRECDGTTHTAAYHADLFEAFNLGSLAERADKVLQIFALVFTGKLVGRCSDGLENDADSALGRVCSCHGQRDPFPVLVHTKDDKLACLGLICNTGSQNIHSDYRGIQNCFANDLIHDGFLS